MLIKENGMERHTESYFLRITSYEYSIHEL